jgi:hypothetical protein
MERVINGINKDDVYKAIRKGSRDADYEIRDGWVAKDRPHKNKKKYDRKTSQSWRKDLGCFVLHKIKLFK